MFVQIAKKAFTIGSATLVSRIFGFLRDILIAFFFGTASSAQAFVVAFRLPNIWRSFIGEEAVNAAVVPVLSEYRSKGKENQFWELSFSLLGFCFLSFSVLAITGVLFAPLLVRIIAPGFGTDPEKYFLSVKLTRLIFPFILLIGLTAVGAGIAISQRKFWSYSWAPLILNFSIILLLVFWGKRYGVYALAFGIMLGGVLELGLQFLALRTIHPPRAKFSLYHPEYKRIGKLLVPRFLGAGIYQINVIIDTVLASLEKIVGMGGIAALYYAQRFVQLPLAIFASSLATAVLPFFSEQVASRTLSKLGENVALSLRSVFFVMIPASLGLVLLSKDIIAAFLQYGKFSIYSTEITSQALAFYALGLVFYAGIKILVSTFYSLQDTLTPVKVSLSSLFINLGLSLILMFPLKLAGLCLATSIAAGFNFSRLFWILRKKVNLNGDKVLSSFLRSLASGGFMALVLIFSKGWLAEIVEARLIRIFTLILISVISYLVGSSIFNSADLLGALKWRKRK